MGAPPRTRPGEPIWYYPPQARPPKDRYGLHIGLFLLTLISTIWAGGGMVGRFDHYEAMARWIEVFGLRLNIDFMLDGLRFGGSLLLFLTVHEFGHYFAARHHRVRTSLPYYIPFPFNGIGTFGAVIRIRDQVPSLRKLFDIGAAGPLAGFVVSLVLLIYGLVALPEPEYVLGLGEHEALKEYVEHYGVLPPNPDPGEAAGALTVGQTPLYWLLTRFVPSAPPMHEMYHYPFLFAGWLGLFFTALNLLPAGQLDGGHILYALVGPKWHRRVARWFVVALLLSGAIGCVEATAGYRAASLGRESMVWLGLAAILFLYLRRIFDKRLGVIAAVLLGIVAVSSLAAVVGRPLLRFGYTGWLIFGALIVFLIRVDHPPVTVNEPLTRWQRVAAWTCVLVFLLCFSLKPLYIQ